MFSIRVVQTKTDRYNPYATKSNSSVLSVLLTIVFKWIWDVRAEKKELKRKLYLELTDAITEGMAVLAAFAEAETPITALRDRFVKAAGVISKTEVVAPDELLQALADLNEVGGKAFQELMRARLPLEKFRADIITGDPFIKKYDEDIDAVQTEQKRMNIEGDKDYDRFVRLQKQYEFARDQRAGFVEKAKQASEGVNEAIAKIGGIVLARQIDLLPHIERVKALTRYDLGFKYDYDGNLERKLEAAEKAREEFQKTQKAVSETFTPDSMKKANDPASNKPA